MCMACEEDQEDELPTTACPCCQWDSENEEDLTYEDDEFAEDYSEQGEPQGELDINEWPCLPVSPDTLAAHQEEMKSRNIPVRLEPGEWARAHAYVRSMMQTHEIRTSYYDSLSSHDADSCPVREQIAPTISIPSSIWEPMPEQPSASNAPWSVKVNKKHKKAKKADGKQSFTGMLSVDGDDAICMAGQEWERIELTVDSGAAETICPASMATTVPTQPGPKTIQGVKYTCAGGRKLPNFGEKRCTLATNDSANQRSMTMQVADVSRPLLSFARSVDAGNRMVFDQQWSYIEDKRTGERTTLTRQGGLYVLDAWIKGKPISNEPPVMPFGRQGPQK